MASTYCARHPRSILRRFLASFLEFVILELMIYSLSGMVAGVFPDAVIIENNGIGYKVSVSKVTTTKILVGQSIQLYCHHHIREDAFDLYGFLDERSLELYKKLLSISGVGPKSGLSIMDVDTIDHVIAGINEGKVDLISRASGIGKKTAQRIVLELKGKLSTQDLSHLVSQAEGEIELEETLIGLGYSRADARSAIESLDPELKDFQDKLRAVLKKKP